MTRLHRNDGAFYVTDMNYIENIPSIHYSERTPGLPITPLSDAVRSAQSTGEVQQHVRRALRIAEDLYRPHPDAETLLDSAQLNQVTNCLGYTIVGSECLDLAAEAIGPHYILFINGHALLANVTETEEGERLHSLDFMIPAVNTDITSGLDTSVSQFTTHTRDTSHPRGAARIDTRVFATAQHSFDMLAHNNGWLYSSNSTAILQSNNWSLTSRPSAFKLIASIYEPSVGRRVLEQYDRFKRAVAVGHVTAAATILHEMDGLYPEIDARQKHQEIKNLVGDLAARQEVTVLRQAIADYTRSFVRSQDPRLVALEATLYRIAAKALDDSSLGEQAVDAYEQAASRSRHTWWPTVWRTQAANVRATFK